MSPPISRSLPIEVRILGQGSLETIKEDALRLCSHSAVCINEGSKPTEPIEKNSCRKINIFKKAFLIPIVVYLSTDTSL